MRHTTRIAIWSVLNYLLVQAIASEPVEGMNYTENAIPQNTSFTHRPEPQTYRVPGTDVILKFVFFGPQLSSPLTQEVLRDLHTKAKDKCENVGPDGLVPDSFLIVDYPTDRLYFSLEEVHMLTRSYPRFTCRYLDRLLAGTQYFFVNEQRGDYYDFDFDIEVDTGSSHRTIASGGLQRYRLADAS